MPIEAATVNGGRPSATNGDAANAARIRVATASAASRSVSGRMSANSSPPYRAATSEARSVPRISSATWTRTPSP